MLDQCDRPHAFLFAVIALKAGPQSPCNGDRDDRGVPGRSQADPFDLAGSGKSASEFLDRFHVLLKIGIRFRVASSGALTDITGMDGPEMKFTQVDSPVGNLLLAGRDGKLLVVSFAGGRGARKPQPGWQRDDALFMGVARQLEEYFLGKRIGFDLALEPQGNEFQLAVWRRMLEIPYGETATYGEVARDIGQSAAASRAVGEACGQNPLPIVVPCHRVVGANGALTGFGGGIWRKKHLLDLEFRVRPPADTLFAQMQGRAGAA
jgi:methylated-DNA-[protein]-cysteine S-methyltransferase